MLVTFFVSEYVELFVVRDVDETIASGDSWSALSFPGVPTCPAIQLH